MSARPNTPGRIAAELGDGITRSDLASRWPANCKLAAPCLPPFAINQNPTPSTLFRSRPAEETESEDGVSGPPGVAASEDKSDGYAATSGHSNSPRGLFSAAMRRRTQDDAVFSWGSDRGNDEPVRAISLTPQATALADDGRVPSFGWTPPGAPTAPIGDIAQGPGLIDRPQQTVPRNSQIANQIVRFTRNQPRTITSSNMQPTMQNSIVRFKPVAQPANPQTTSLQLNVSGKLGQLRLNPQILGANTNLSSGQTERFMAAMTRVQAIDDYLSRGGHLVFERSISDGGVAHYFPPGWGGNNGAVADEYNRLLQQPNVSDSYPAPDRLSVTEERNRLLAIRKNAEDEVLSILENGRDGDRNPLIRPSGIQASLGDIAGAIGRVRLPAPVWVSFWGKVNSDPKLAQVNTDLHEYAEDL